MLTLLFIITFTNIQFISGVENDTEFINSLPEKKKTEFHQKVEKRIQKEVPEVKNPEGNDTNVDLYEKQLEDQGKSIQSILRSEIDNIKTDYRGNTTETRSGHIDLTFRSHDEDAVRRDGETNKFPKKSIMFENIPVAVQYDSANSEKTPSTFPVETSNKDAQIVKKESKLDVITWENTSSLTNKNNKTDTPPVRKRSGRKSNDYDAPLNGTVIKNTSSSAVTDAEDFNSTFLPRKIELIDDYNKKLSRDGSTTRGVSLRAENEKVATKLNSYTSSGVTQTVSLQRENENKTTDLNTAVTHRVTIQAENEKKTTQGNNSKIIDITNAESLEYMNPTQKNTISSTLNYLTKDTIDSSFITELVGIDTTILYDSNSHINDQFSSTTKYDINSQTNREDVRTTQGNRDKIAKHEKDAMSATNYLIPSNKGSKLNIKKNVKSHSVVNITVLYDNNYLQNGNKFSSTTQNSVNLQSNSVDFSATHNNLDNSTLYYNIITTEPTEKNKTIFNTNTTIDTEVSSTMTHESYTTSNIVDKSTNQNTKDLKKIDIISTTANGDYLNTAKDNSDSISTTNSLPDGLKRTAIDKLTSNNQHLTNQDNIIVVIDNQPEVKLLDDVYADVYKIHNNTTTDKNGIIAYNETNYTTLGIVNTDSLGTHQAIIVGSQKLDDIAANFRDDNESMMKSGNVYETTEHGDTKIKLGPNSQISVNENQPKYVPVYNYDPENAYFNPNIERPIDETDKQESDTPDFIKKTETHLETTSLDVYLNGNKQSLRIKDIKERVTSASKIKKYSDLYDVLLAGGSIESSKDEASYEKPLKHSLSKIREKLYKYKTKSKPMSDEGNHSNNDETTVRKIYNTVKNKHEEDNVTQLFRNFGSVLKKIAYDYNNNEKFSEFTKGSNGDSDDSDRDLYKNVANSLEKHNKIIKNENLKEIVEKLVEVQNKLDKRHKYKNDQSLFQSRFLVKDRDEKYKVGDDKDDEEAYISIIKDENGPFTIKGYDDNVDKAKGSKNGDDYLNVHFHILKDLVDKNDGALIQYDWLGSTVLIQAGIAKLLDTVDQKIRHKKLHPLDRDLLELSMKLHKSAIAILAEENDGTPTKRKRLSFRIPKPKKGTKSFNTLNRMYGEMKKTRAISLIRSRYTVEDFKEFLTCVRSCLNDFHTAIKEISYITTFKKQRWYKNIKQLYLQSAGEKEYLELLLHLVTARLIALIEEREKKIVNGTFDKRDREEDRIAVEVVMTLRICKELMRINE